MPPRRQKKGRPRVLSTGPFSLALLPHGRALQALFQGGGTASAPPPALQPWAGSPLSLGGPRAGPARRPPGSRSPRGPLGPVPGCSRPSRRFVPAAAPERERLPPRGALIEPLIIGSGLIMRDPPLPPPAAGPPSVPPLCPPICQPPGPRRSGAPPGPAPPPPRAPRPSARLPPEETPRPAARALGGRAALPPPQAGGKRRRRSRAGGGTRGRWAPQSFAAKNGALRPATPAQPKFSLGLHSPGGREIC